MVIRYIAVNDRARSDDAAVANSYPIEYGCIHSDKAMCSYGGVATYTDMRGYKRMVANSGVMTYVIARP